MSDAPRRKLIEVALPLEAINRASVREKSIRHGHPSTLHLWWARRPLAACRAVLFASLVDDPSERAAEFPTQEAQDAERGRLLRLMEDLVTWEATTDETILEKARKEIRRSTGGNPPPVLDPFCGGGSIPLEAQRLGLEAHGSDLNPVAVLITKALIEIPARFADHAPVNPEAREKLQAGGWRGARGLADDVRYYGAWMRAEAQKKIGHLYPKASLPDGGEATVIAWLWARVVTCPNPACGAAMPLVSTFSLATKRNKEAWVEPIVNRNTKTVEFVVRTGRGVVPDTPKVGRGANFRCLVCEEVAAEEHIQQEGRAGRMTARLLAVVAEGSRKRIYVSPDSSHESAAATEEPPWRPRGQMPDNPRWFSPPRFGIEKFGDLFTNRQLTALTTFSDLVSAARELAIGEARNADAFGDDERPLAEGGTGAKAYGDAVAVYLGFAVDRSADGWSSQTSWRQGVEATRGAFSRQALPMVWDFAEANPFSSSCGNWTDAGVEWIRKALEHVPASGVATAQQLDAAASVASVASSPVISTDPPYYDNIGYADLSDFFYVWMRHSLGDVFPDLFSTLMTPKAKELVATPYRFDGDKAAAQQHFEIGLGAAFDQMQLVHAGAFPLTVFYAFKQSEAEADGTASTGWETMLEGLLAAGFGITGTWPMRTERGARSVAIGTAALASSVVLVCRPRPHDAPLATRKEFTAGLRAELPDALKHLQQGAIAPVDLAQASIGPGMAVFSRYSKVVEADGEAMRVRTALALINEALDELLAEQEADFDPDTRWCVAWFEQYAMNEGPFGVAETLSRAKNTSISGLVDAGVLRSAAGKVSLIERDELAEAWDPSSDTRLTVWEVTQHLIRRLEHGGEQSAAELLRQVGGLAEPARELAYRLFQICDRKKWASEALGYNALAAAWLEITRLAAADTSVPDAPVQEGLDI